MNKNDEMLSNAFSLLLQQWKRFDTNRVAVTVEMKHKLGYLWSSDNLFQTSKCTKVSWTQIWLDILETNPAVEGFGPKELF